MVKDADEIPRIGSTVWGNPQVMEAAIWLVANGYPDEWRTVTPPPATLASAVAYVISERDQIDYEDAVHYFNETIKD